MPNNDPMVDSLAEGSGGGPHTHAWSDITGEPATYTPSAHSHAEADVTGLTAALAAKQATSAKGQANGYAGLGADGKVPSAQLPASGSDPWTIVKLASDFPTSSATAVDTGLAFTPLANTTYIVEGSFMVRTATATVGPRPGCAWPTGCTDGVASIQQTSSATANVFANGNIVASVLAPVGGVPTTTGSWPAFLWGVFTAGAAPSGTFKVQLASETAGTTVTMKAGSFLRYRAI